MEQFYVFMVLITGAAASFDDCNQTISEGITDTEKLTLKLAEVAAVHHGSPVYCWFRFRAASGQYVQVDVREVRAGMYDNTKKDCSTGYLRISDEESCSTDPRWLPPTTLCGHYPAGEVMVKRLTRSPLAFVEFKLDTAKQSTGYEFDVTFLDKALCCFALFSALKDLENGSYGEEGKFPYGDLQRMNGRIQHTKCDWLIPVNECIGWCPVVSPGFPGIYPPNTRCRYTFTNFGDGRVELRLGGRGFTGKFDMKKDANCSDDFVEIYDGASSLTPLIGRYCGLRGHHLISTGPSLLLIFQSGPGGPPWDYSGFKIEASDRWKNEHEGGFKDEGEHCDWTFRSRDSKDGNIHTPDHFSHGDTLCTFTFLAEYNEKVEIRIVINRVLDENCTETVSIYNGDANDTNSLDVICGDRIGRRREVFAYNTTGCTGTVQYYRQNFQVSNPNPVWVYYVFWKDPTIKAPPVKTRASEAGVAKEFHVDDVQIESSSSVVVMSWLLLVTSLWTVFTYKGHG